MPDIKKFPNIIEAMKYLEPGHLLTQCLERDGVAINYQSNMPVSMPDGRIALLCPSPNPNYYRGENGVYPAVNPVSTGSRNAKIRSAPWRRLMNLCVFC